MSSSLIEHSLVVMELPPGNSGDSFEICGKFCRTAAPVGNDSISRGNINKKWNKEDVKSIFVEGVPSSWGQAKLTEIFKNYGKIEHIFLSRNVQSSKKRGYACIKYMAHEAAMLCLESFYKKELTENGSKVNIKVSMAKSVLKSKQNKEHTFSFSENDKAVGKVVSSFNGSFDRTSYTTCASLDCPPSAEGSESGFSISACFAGKKHVNQIQQRISSS